MRLLPSDPDIQTIIARIKSGVINLQPEFQRGEVWGDSKKRRLIDSILRDWHVPPIHIIEVKENGRQEVLDGQQRLVAIRDFVNGEVVVDGYTEPFDYEISELNNLGYNNLPEFWKNRFDQFTIRIFKIVDYLPSEPGELFYRLNQPTSLTAAEQRNAFFGPARQQVKDIVTMFNNIGLNKDFLGFSNSRMAFDDVVSKFFYILDSGTLLEKVTSNSVTNKYRSQEEFRKDTLYRVHKAVDFFGEASVFVDYKAKFNKATLFSWLCFIAQLHSNSVDISSKILGRYISFFEQNRISLKTINMQNKLNMYKYEMSSFDEELLRIFNDRASSRVADTTSVIARDIVLWYFFNKFVSAELITIDNHIEPIEKIEWFFKSSFFPEDPSMLISSLIDGASWGEHI
ncbi:MULTISPECIES: DUF262 domain-containing protein [Paenibacillus]|uniref:DUF262 domain-containing protein n=1 Tax=Paenibacillus TaxID=44249 RepID=UPI00096E471C|nr:MULTISPECIES: DUF262 domain-containing protein [Paenibacillus]OMF76861.1 hypothetical protein BK145_20195 [Paenibacillus peoriae]QYK59930.1 hypothetical protein KAI37_00212 [Paenibacillus sp. S25]